MSRNCPNVPDTAAEKSGPVGDSRESLGWRQGSPGFGGFFVKFVVGLQNPVRKTPFGFREMPLKAFFCLCYEAGDFKYMAASASKPRERMTTKREQSLVLVKLGFCDAPVERLTCDWRS